MPFEKYDNNLYNITQVQIEKQNISIAEKVKNNKAFSIEEKNIVKLQYFLDNKNYTVSETLLDSYIGRKF